MNIVVFTGPTLRPEEGNALLPSATFRGPAACGDVLQAAESGYHVIAVIDGYIDQQQPVWHKELLWALSRGLHVWGAASMGALRAAELASFGMRGVGAIFEALACGALDADDEVVVTHAPASRGFAPLSEALVNVRATLREAVRAEIISRTVAEQISRAAQSLFYADRTYENIFSALSAEERSSEEVTRLREWLAPGRGNRVDQKRKDALALIAELARDPAPAGSRPSFAFSNTYYWAHLRERKSSAGSPPTAHTLRASSRRA